MGYLWLMTGKYKSKRLLLENLLLLYLVAAANPRLVGTGQYNKLSSFQVSQIAILRALASSFSRMVTTAHILTEVSNHVSTLHDAGKLRIFRAFADTLEVVSEREFSSYRVARRREFQDLGLTDSVLAELADEFLIVSNDGRSVDILRQTGIDALRWVEVLGLSA